MQQHGAAYSAVLLIGRQPPPPLPHHRHYQVFQSHRVQRAFKLLKRVVMRKGEDIAAALLIMFISLIFIATVMYIIEGGSHEVTWYCMSVCRTCRFTQS